MTAAEIDALVESTSASAPTAAEHRQLQKDRKGKEKKKGKKGKKKAMKARKNKKDAEQTGKNTAQKKKEDAEQTGEKNKNNIAQKKKKKGEKKTNEAQIAVQINAHFSKMALELDGHAHVELVETVAGRSELAKMSPADFSVRRRGDLRGEREARA